MKLKSSIGEAPLPPDFGRSRSDIPEREIRAPVPRLAQLRKKSRQRATLAIWAVGLDLLCITAAFLIAGFARMNSFHFEQVSSILISVLPIYLGVTLNNQAHQITALLDGFRSAWRAQTAFLFAAASVLLIAFFMKIGSEFSRLLFGLGTFLALIFLGIARAFIARVGRRYLGKSPFANLCIYDGVPRGKRSGEGSIDAADFGVGGEFNNREAVARLAELTKNMDRVIIHCLPELRRSWSFMLKSLDIPSEIVVPEMTKLAPISIHMRSGQASLQLASGPLAWNQKLVKRVFDLFVVFLLLPALLPIIAVVAVLIKIDSPGPIFFSQQRIGRGNRSFRILKFRSMRVESCDTNGNLSTLRNDNRITRLGNFIRRTSIDELPQFFNVLMGDMSIVGPRPHAEGSRAENRLFWDIDARYWHRHSIKPGLTGLAQIRGFRGSTEVVSDLSNRLMSDLEYVAHWSVLLDVKIIIKTFSVLTHKNAF